MSIEREIFLRRVPVYTLYPGLKVARTVYSKNGQALLTAGTVLTKRFIERLTLLGIQWLYVEDGLVPDIQIDDVIMEETRVRAASLVRSMFDERDQGFNSVIKRSSIVSKEMSQAISEIIDQLMENRNAVINLLDIRTCDEYTFSHSVNVCVLSIITGISLGYDRQRLSSLGMGTLLHDVGKTHVPQEILKKPAALSSEEFEEIKKHCYFGQQIIKNTCCGDIVAASVALQHHERFDGMGYPRGLKGKQIHEFSRIAGIADTYDAVTVDRVYRKAIPPNEAWELISGSGGHFFDYKITSAFLSRVAAYPLGTLVLLNSNEVGVVIENVKGYSNFPRIRIIFDDKGRYLNNYSEVWLADQTDLFIVRAIDDIRSVFISDQKALKA